MKEQFANYKISLELNKLGFDEECLGCFPLRIDPSIHILEIGNTVLNNSKTSIKAPLWQQAWKFILSKLPFLSSVELFDDGSCVLHDIEENVDYAYSFQRETMLKAIELCKNKK